MTVGLAFDCKNVWRGSRRNHRDSWSRAVAPSKLLGQGVTACGLLNEAWRGKVYNHIIKRVNGIGDWAARGGRRVDSGNYTDINYNRQS